MDIRTKYDVGQHVAAFHEVNRYITCPNCKGEKRMVVGQAGWVCAKCGGRGEVHHRTQWETGVGQIQHIMVDGTGLHYHLLFYCETDEGSPRHLKSLYKTFAEDDIFEPGPAAQAECDRRNAERGGSKEDHS